MQQHFAVRILVVEDEIGVRRSLIGKLRGIELPIEISGEAENAEQALEMMKQDMPDIVLLDMRMPGMGGYRFLPILKEQFSKVRVIILSGYSDFEYVLQSLRNGAEDYLLKPVIKEDLEMALRKTIQSIRYEVEQNNQNISNGMLLNQAVPLLKHQIMNRMLKPQSALQAAEKLGHLGIFLDYPGYMMILVRILDYSKTKSRYLEESTLVFFVFENIVNDTLSEPIHCFPHEHKEGEFVCLIGLPEGESPQSEIAGWQTRLERLIENMKQFGKIQSQLLVTQTFQSLRSAGLVYRQAVEHADISGAEAQVSYLGDKVDSGWMADVASEMGLDSLVTAIEERNIRELTGLIQAVFDKSKSPRQAAAAAYYALEQSLDKLFVEPESMRQRMPGLSGLLERVSDSTGLQKEMLVLAVQIGEAASKRNQGESRQMICQAQKYIEQFYFEDITLESISKKFYLNRTYFSELFKNETGWTFKKYVNHIRIEKAKQLLIDHELRPSVVAELVGIKDPVYFTVLFKKTTGLPPGEYQKTKGG
ncbi:response regulator transcription factor [Cohnella mopanensis]|uniref:response regulator transcription factor n=1 Tax=Cohnella mopanensis TaxID=2911966 RepID=UPI001EF8FFDC|nr:response regulator [Cohnella mopanensis]